KFSGNEAFPEGNLVAYMVLTAAVTIVCMAIIYLIQKVFGKRSRMVVGA
ncbi:MAG: hypothetical protein ACI9GW_003702, partial [Halieaceae bacterium]